MKKTVSVSIDEGVLARAKELAWESRKTFSEYVEMKISSEEEVKKTVREKKIELSRGKDLSSKISPVDEKMLREKMEAIAKKKPESLTGWSGGISKAQQVGKGGSK